jgi:hypothetical protein
MAIYTLTISNPLSGSLTKTIKAELVCAESYNDVVTVTAYDDENESKVVAEFTAQLPWTLFREDDTE